MAVGLIIGQLARQPLFQGLTPRHLEEIARRARAALYRPGAVIIEQNAEGDGAILIVAGEAARVSGPELRSRQERVRPGSLLGEAAMLVETRHGSTVVARGHVCALHILRNELQAQMARDPAIAGHILENLGRRLASLAEELRRADAVLAGSARTPPPRPAQSLQSIPAH